MEQKALVLKDRAGHLYTGDDEGIQMGAVKGPRFGGKNKPTFTPAMREGYK